ncbi:tryptophan synthase subunit alpha [Chloroflexota bacterium]
MSHINTVFKPSYKALLAYLTVGYPDLEATRRAAVALAENGVDIIELGIPFSDPLADGTTIQKASYRALQQGVTLQGCFDMAGQLQREITVPLVFMTYYNPVFTFGLEPFCRKCNEAGISGLIIPDLPPEEGEELEVITRKHQLDLIYLLAPTSSEERIAAVAKRSRGFIYLVSLTGVTGARQTLPVELKSFIGRVKQQAKQPLCVGFGIASPEQASRVAGIADGVIIGSRLIQLIEEDATLARLKEFTSSIRHALDKR